VKHAPASRIPEPDASFDLVFSNSALEHMEPLDPVLAEVARVLRPGGRFVFTVPTPALDDLLLWRRLLHAAGFERLAERYCAAMDRRLQHRNLLTADHWRDTLAAHGLETLEMLPYLTAHTIAVWELLSNLTGGLAWLVSGGVYPRDIQRKTGMLRGRSAVAGAVTSILLFPALALASAGERDRTGALYVEARRV
jgi:SAM-dependent methyltransferase